MINFQRKEDDIKKTKVSKIKRFYIQSKENNLINIFNIDSVFFTKIHYYFTSKKIF